MKPLLTLVGKITFQDLRKEANKWLRLFSWRNRSSRTESLVVVYYLCIWSVWNKRTNAKSYFTISLLDFFFKCFLSTLLRLFSFRLSSSRKEVILLLFIKKSIIIEYDTTGCSSMRSFHGKGSSEWKLKWINADFLGGRVKNSLWKSFLSLKNTSALCDPSGSLMPTFSYSKTVVLAVVSSLSIKWYLFSPLNICFPYSSPKC